MTTKSRRRSSRNAQTTDLKSPSPARSNISEKGEEEDSPVDGDDESKCPSCTTESSELSIHGKEKWIMCDACKTWYHWRCAGSGDDLETIDKWYCNACLQTDERRSITFKTPARKSHRKRSQRDYANLNTGVEADPKRWMRMMDGKRILKDCFKHMNGSDVTMNWLIQDDNALDEPIVIDSPEGLEMKMPSGDFTVNDVADLVGKDTPLEVMDVATQSASPGWTLGKWAEYFNLTPSERDKTLNVISLEVSGTPLADKILPPKIVRELDWVQSFWPSTKKGKGHLYPKVQLYCLMGTASSWTDWHIDFAGSSVYYHIVRGSKIFYFIRPTAANLAAYERWSGTDIQNHIWLGDLVDDVIKVELVTGNTMIIPTGWIHAVDTPVDTLVFGGNFLHSYNMSTQLKVRDIEIATHVPKKFRFPFFTKLCWYVGDKYLRDLKNLAAPPFHPRVLASIRVLASFLVKEVRTLENGPESAKKEIKEQIPSDRVKDPGSMARELRWRARLAAGVSSDDEESDDRVKGLNGQIGAVSRRKRKWNAGDGMYRNFEPKPWDVMNEKAIMDEVRTVKRRRPDEKEDLTTRWSTEMLEDDGSDSERAEVTTRRNTVVKLRQISGGLEREQIERVVEEWIWR